MTKRVNKLKKRKITSKNVVNTSNNQIKINSEIDIYGAQFEFKENVEINSKHKDFDIYSNPVGKRVIVINSNLSNALNEKVLFGYKSKGKFSSKLKKVILSDNSGNKVTSIIK